MTIPEAQARYFQPSVGGVEEADRVEVASQESFPASDPPSWVSGVEPEGWMPDGGIASSGKRQDAHTTVLQNKKLIPPLTLCESQGRIVHAWDFKQKRNLVIAFLDANCSLCEEFIRVLAAHAEALDQREAVTLLVFPAMASPLTRVSLPPTIIAGTDVKGEGAVKFLGSDALSAQGFVRHGIFVTDRYGALSEQWTVEQHGFPHIRQILNVLDQIEMACEECGDARWLHDG